MYFRFVGYLCTFKWSFNLNPEFFITFDVVGPEGIPGIAVAVRHT